MNISIKAKLAACLWLLIIVLLISSAWHQKSNIDTSMMSLLPTSQQQPMVREASFQMGRQFSQRLLIIVSSEDKHKRQAAVQQLANAYQDVPQVRSVLWRFEQQRLTDSQQALKPYRYVLLTEQQRQDVLQQQTASLRMQAIAAILNPVSFKSLDLTADPFGLMQSWQAQQEFKLNIELQDDYLQLSEAKNSYLLILELADDAFSIQTQQAVLSVFNDWQSKFANQQINLQASGLLIHADAGAKQAQWEMSTIGLGSLLGITLLMWSVFRRLSTVLMVFLPLAIGCAVATAIAFLVFERVHIVTFAFGAGLVGVAVDYALHYVCERQTRPNALQSILAGLALGLFSSVLAYAAQAITPFPGLRQMAVFSVSGLIAAWLTVVLWLPLLANQQAGVKASLGAGLITWQIKLPNIHQQLWLKPFLVLITIGAVLVIINGRTVDDIRLLQTSSDELIKQESHLHGLLGLNSSTQFLLLHCDQEQDCLEREERIQPLLQSWLAGGKLNHYQMLSQQVPSLSRQDQNVLLVEQLYQQELADLFATLNLPELLQAQAQAKLHQDLDKRFSIEQAQSATIMPANSLFKSEQYGMATVISYSATTPLSDDDLAQLQQLTEGIELIDQVDAISSLMHNYRLQMMMWVSLAYLLLIGILAWRYKQAMWRIITPPLLASIYTVALLSQILPGINLFHVMALILVLGIGIDMGIFLTETKQAQQTWLAVSLSVATSLMAFGLLALSQTPVLTHFGLTVLLGLSFVWLLTTMLRQPSLSRSKNLAGT